MHPTRFTVAPSFHRLLTAREGEGRRARLSLAAAAPSRPSRLSRPSPFPTPPPPQRGAAAPARAVTYMAGGGPRGAVPLPLGTGPQ